MPSTIGNILIVIGILIVFASHIMLLQATVLPIEQVIPHAALNIIAGIMILIGVILLNLD